jgi:zona occludens toxin
MSIVAYVGLPRSGKSYGVVENVIIPSLDKGRIIATNIPLKKGYLLDDYPKGTIITFTNKEALEAKQNGEIFFTEDRFPQGTVIIIDECWRFWSGGTKASSIPEQEKSFFTEHGHNVGADGFTNEIVLVTQGLNQVCSFVRELVEETFYAKKLSMLGQSKRYQITVYSQAALGQKPNNLVVRTLQGSYKPDVYKYYKSHTKNKTDFAAGMEEKADERGNMLKSPLIKYGLIIAIIIIIFGVRGVYGYFTRFDIEDKPTTIEPTNSPTQKSSIEVEDTQEFNNSVVAQEQRTFNLNTGYLELSDDWRIVGQIANNFMIQSEKRGSRLIPTSICTLDLHTSEDVCIYSDQLVTWYSAAIPNRSGENSRSAGDAIIDSF